MANIFGTINFNHTSAMQEEIHNRTHLFPWLLHESAQHGPLFTHLFHPETAPPPCPYDLEDALVIICGELYIDDLKRNELPQAVLQALQRDGVEALNRFNGNYTLIVWLKRERRLLIANDRLGMQPLYYWQRGGKFIFSTKIAPMLVMDEVGRGIDPYGVNDFMSLGWVTGKQTLFKEISRLLPGALLVFQDGNLSIKRQQMVEFSKSHWNRTALQFSDEMYETLLEAYRVRAKESGKTLIPLSGGLDSRVNVAFWHRLKGNDFDTMTYGAPYHCDRWAAKKVARTLNVPHAMLPFSRDYIKRYMPRHLSVIEGNTDVVNAQLFPVLDYAGNRYNDIVMGTLGGPITGYSVDFAQIGDPTDEQKYLDTFIGHWRLKPEELASIYAPGIPKDAAGVMQAAIEENFHECKSATELFQRLTYVDLPQSQRGFIFAHIIACSLMARTRCPFLDRQYVDLMCSASPALLEGQNAYRVMIQRHFPELARIVNANDDRPILNDRHGIVNLFRHLLVKQVVDKTAHFATRFRGRVSTGAVTSMWDTRSWPDYHVMVEYMTHLLNKQDTWKDLFEPDRVRQVLAEYEQSKGLKHRVLIRRLSRLLLFFEKFVEAPSSH